jgi:methyl-accepting chemotaxis protein
MRLVRHAPIGAKVALAPVFAILCMAGVVSVALRANLEAKSSLGQISESHMVALSQAAEFDRKIGAINTSVNQSLVWEGAGVKAETIATLDGRITRDLDELGRQIGAQGTNAVWSDADRATWKQVVPVFDRFRKSALETLDIKSMGLGAAAGFITRSESSYKELQQLIDTLVEQQVSAARQEAERAVRGTRKSVTVTLGGLVLAVVLSAAGTWWTARLIARPLGRAVTVLRSLAVGDFTRRMSVEGPDAVGQAAGAVNQAVDGMTAALREVRGAASQAAAASHHVAEATEHLSGSAQEQAASLEETAASIEEITGTVQQTADNARQASELASSSRDTAEKGGTVVSSAVGAMEEITRASRRIAAIIGTIDDIAFQTNLLALNAAVEAARAGEQGRGFAVVATEVRNLAQRAAGAAREIKGLIEDSVGKVAVGSELVTRAGETLREIVTGAGRVTDLIADIATASQEQRSGIEQVSRAVTRMDQVVQSTVAQTEELSSTSKALATQAEQLQTLVQRFKMADDIA